MLQTSDEHNLINNFETKLKKIPDLAPQVNQDLSEFSGTQAFIFCKGAFCFKMFVFKSSSNNYKHSAFALGVVWHYEAFHHEYCSLMSW